jgi:hypothetical protein
MLAGLAEPLTLIAVWEPIAVSDPAPTPELLLGACGGRSE